MPKPSGDLSPLLVVKRPTHNLPLVLSSFIGREREIEEVKQWLSEARLVTLTGTGGCGKTRLVIQVASDVLDWFEDGVWWVELAPLADETLVPQAVAQALDVREVPQQALTDTLASHLQPKQLLLVLDNCEHLITACALLIEQLLRACPNLKILATSRESLAIGGERVYPVPSLSLPDPQVSSPKELLRSEAVRLFVERARSVKPDFVLVEQNAREVAQICQRLDGIPLAIELAAARVKMLTVAHIAERLDDRFSLLTTGHRTALPRHQTLRATIDWSYDLLPEEARVLFRRLAVFAGGFTLTAAEQICSDTPLTARAVLDLLARLVDRSLVLVDQQHGDERYWMLETIREYARDKLLESGEIERVRNRHLDFFLHLAEEAEPQLEGPEQATWLNRLDSEHDNMLAALEWGRMAKGNAELSLRLVGALGEFWESRGYFHEGREHLSAALSRPEALERTAARAQALYQAGHLAYLQSDYPASRHLFEASLSIDRELGPPRRRGLANTLILLGYMETELGDYATASSLIKEGLSIMRELNDKGGMARALWFLGGCAVRPGEYQQAVQYYGEALLLLRQLGDKDHTAQALSGLAEVALREGDDDRATALENESLALKREVGDKWGIAVCFGNFAWLALRREDLQQAVTLLKESLTLRREMGDIGGIAWCLEKFAQVALTRGQRESPPRRNEEFRRAVRLFGAAAALRAPIGSVIDLVDRPEYERQLGILRGQLDGPAEPAPGLGRGSEPGRGFEAAWAEGQAMTTEQAIEHALETSATWEQLAGLVPPLTPRQTAQQQFGGLTARERQVAALIAQGKSNREIAAELVVSERTVESHVANILNKLAFSARTQIAAWSVKEGLAYQKAE